jgi:hypothetical protein
LIPFWRPSCRCHEVTAAHPRSWGKLAADAWSRRAVPLLGGLCGKANRDCVSLPDGVARLLAANSKHEIVRLWPTRDCSPRRQSLSVLTNCTRMLFRSSSEVGGPMRDRRWRNTGRYCNRVARLGMNKRSGLSQGNWYVIRPATTRHQTMIHCHNKYSAHIVKRECVWEALDVSGRGTAPAKPALYVGVVDE